MTPRHIRVMASRPDPTPPPPREHLQQRETPMLQTAQHRFVDAEGTDAELGQRRLARAGGWFFSNRWVVAGAGVMLLIVLASRLVIGSVYSGFEARRLVEAMSESALYLSAALATASATIIALMLTILGLTRHATDGFELAFFTRVKTIATMSTIALVGSVALLTVLSIPLEESESIAIGWYTTVYWVYSGVIAVLAGLFVAIVLLLLAAVYGIIRVLAPGGSR